MILGFPRREIGRHGPAAGCGDRQQLPELGGLNRLGETRGKTGAGKVRMLGPHAHGSQQHQWHHAGSR